MKKFSFNKLHLHIRKDRFFGRRSELQRDWKIILVAFGAIVLFWLFISLYLFFKISREDIFVVEEETEDVITRELNKREISEALQSVREMQLEFENIRAEGIGVSDPAR